MPGVRERAHRGPELPAAALTQCVMRLGGIGRYPHRKPLPEDLDALSERVLPTRHLAGAGATRERVNMGLSMSMIAAVEAKQSVLAAGMVDIDMSLVFMLGLFLTFAVLLHFLVMKPLLASHEKRHAGMGGAREDASAAELKVAELKLDYEKRLGKARQEAVVVRDAIRKDANAEAASVTALAQATHAAKVDAQKRELEAAATKVRGELGTHANAMADTLASKLLGGKA